MCGIEDPELNGLGESSESCPHSCPTHSFRITMPTTRVPKTVTENLAVIAWIEEHGQGIPTRAPKHFHDELGWKISGSQVRQWWKRRAILRATESQRRRVSGGGSKSVLRELEDNLVDQVCTCG